MSKVSRKNTNTPIYSKLKPQLLKYLKFIAIGIAVFIAFFPFLWLLMTAFKSMGDIQSLPPKIIFSPTLDNFRAIMDANFFKYLQNSLILTFSGVSLSMILGVPAAFAISRLKIPFKDGILFFILALRFVPYIVFALPLFLLFVERGWVGTRYGVVMAYILINLPLIIWLMKGFFDEIPKVIDEAAEVDGASRFQIFTRIIVPCAKPGIACVLILAFIFTWNEYLFALILAGRHAQPLTVGLTQFLGGIEYGVRWGALSAWSFTLVFPVVTISLFVNKYLRKGFTGGGYNK